MTVILIFSILSLFLGIILGYIKYVFPIKKNPIVVAVDNLLPQSQCAQCGYSGCYPYAKAIVKDSEKIDKCIPGGSDLIFEIAKVLNIENVEKSLDSSAIKNEKKIYTTVLIDEKNCVGCSKCASFCPVDAIIGAPNFMHTVLQKFCTGCNICLLHCPTNCIKIIKE
ncbi:RnfABCDGE type electron transport complex subunit B [uncultured Buchnera sp.]|uniref:RnfABCDGE type electron transport complex subunit B n=1 Tax=uncultured Buchnera sp. TaxID=574037 RepID=UPI0025EF2704|nr:RnfABCDGE type electron transport complex subunit B [uncultured Buchnera sp.]